MIHVVKHTSCQKTTVVDSNEDQISQIMILVIFCVWEDAKKCEFINIFLEIYIKLSTALFCLFPQRVEYFLF